MITTTTILTGLYIFLDAHKEDIASKVLASASYDVLKNSLDFSALKKKLGRFFKKDDDGEKFVAALCEPKAIEQDAVPAEVKASYEQISGMEFNEEILSEIKTWFAESKTGIQNLNVVNNSGNSGGFNIGSQHAAQNIYNIQGDFNPEKK